VARGRSSISSSDKTPRATAVPRIPLPRLTLAAVAVSAVFGVGALVALAAVDGPGRDDDHPSPDATSRTLAVGAREHDRGAHHGAAQIDAAQTDAGAVVLPGDPTAEAAPPPSAAAFAVVPAGALRAFQDARCAATPRRPLVVVQFGDSHTAGGFMTAALQRALAPDQRSAPGYVPPQSATTQWATSTLRGRWARVSWLRDDGQTGAGVRAGPGGQAAIAPARGTASVELRLRPWSTVVSSPASASSPPVPLVDGGVAVAPEEPAVLPDGGRLTVLHDPETPVPTAALRIDGVVSEPLERVATSMLARTTWQLAPGATTALLDVAGSAFRFHGWVVADSAAHVEFDPLGVGGVTVMHSSRRADHALEEFLAWRRPDLVVVWLGTNDAVAPADEYRRFDGTYGPWLDRLRAAAPQASIVTVGPPDLDRRPDGCPSPTGRGKRRRPGLSREQLVAAVCRPQTLPVVGDGSPVPLKGVRTAADWQQWLSRCDHQTVPTLAHVIDVERTAAQQRGIAFVDLFAWMGGPLSIRRLACLDPPLASLDLVHLKAPGYALIGTAVGDALTAAAPCPAGATATTTTTTR
jgi:lysophospholipase L1-like esterase